MEEEDGEEVAEAEKEKTGVAGLNGLLSAQEEFKEEDMLSFSWSLGPITSSSTFVVEFVLVLLSVKLSRDICAGLASSLLSEFDGLAVTGSVVMWRAASSEARLIESCPLDFKRQITPSSNVNGIVLSLDTDKLRNESSNLSMSTRGASTLLFCCFPDSFSREKGPISSFTSSSHIIKDQARPIGQGLSGMR